MRRVEVTHIYGREENFRFGENQDDWDGLVRACGRKEPTLAGYINNEAIKYDQTDLDTSVD